MKIKFIIKSKNKRFPVKVGCDSYEDGIKMLKSQYSDLCVVSSEVISMNRVEIPNLIPLKREGNRY